MNKKEPLPFFWMLKWIILTLIFLPFFWISFIIFLQAVRGY